MNKEITKDKPETITRAVTLSLYPIANIEKPEFYRLLHSSFDQVQRAANAVLQQYFIGDDADLVEGKTGKMTLAKLPNEISKAAYYAAKVAAPDLPTGAIADICQRVRARYLHDRWAVRVAGRQSVPTFRRPLPLSIRLQDWAFGETTIDDKHHYTAVFPLMHLKRNERPVVGIVARTARDRNLLDCILGGAFERRTLEIMAPGWERKGPVRAKIVYRRPIPKSRTGGGGTLTIRTGSPSLIVADRDGDRPFAWNARGLRGKIIGYDRSRHQRAEDRKHERRMPASRRRVLNQDGGLAAAKHSDRVKTELQHIAAQVVKYAARNGYDAIMFDTTNRTWLDSFPWHKFEDAMEQATINAGLAWSGPMKQLEETP